MGGDSRGDIFSQMVVAFNYDQRAMFAVGKARGCGDQHMEDILDVQVPFIRF